jgi:ribose transport system permease protein
MMNSQDIKVTNQSGGFMKHILNAFSNFREGTILITIIIFSAAIALLSPYFLTVGNLRTTAIGLSADGIIALGMTCALISGGFDLSVGSVLGLSGVTAGALYIAGVNIWLACLIAILVSLVCGIINGVFISKVGINPFITTLAMMGMARGAAFVATQGSPQSLSGVPQSFRMLGTGSILQIPIMVIIFAILAIVGQFLLRNSSPMRKLFYLGSNENAAVLSGIKTARVKNGVYIASALLSGIAGILTLARFGVATPLAGEGTELRVISAAIIGGTSLNGGEGSIFGTVLGVILLNIINNALVLLRVSVYWQAFVSGFILIIAVTIDQISHKRRSRKITTTG